MHTRQSVAATPQVKNNRSLGAPSKYERIMHDRGNFKALPWLSEMRLGRIALKVLTKEYAKLSNPLRQGDVIIADVGLGPKSRCEDWLSLSESGLRIAKPKEQPTGMMGYEDALTGQLLPPETIVAALPNRVHHPAKFFFKNETAENVPAPNYRLGMVDSALLMTAFDESLGRSIGGVEAVLSCIGSSEIFNELQGEFMNRQQAKQNDKTGACSSKKYQKHALHVLCATMFRAGQLAGR